MTFPRSMWAYKKLLNAARKALGKRDYWWLGTLPMCHFWMKP